VSSAILECQEHVRPCKVALFFFFFDSTVFFLFFSQYHRILLVLQNLVKDHLDICLRKVCYCDNILQQGSLVVFVFSQSKTCIFFFFSDMWAFGITCIECITRADPYPGKSGVEAATAVSKGAKPSIPSVWPAPLTAMLQACFDGDPSKRPTARQFLEHLESIR
jgi:serine/threonine protein kinase